MNRKMSNIHEKENCRGRVGRKRDVFAMQFSSRTNKREQRFICKKVRVEKVDI